MDGIAPRLQDGWPHNHSWGKQLFPTSMSADQWFLGPPSILCTRYGQLLLPRVKRLECEADHSPPSTAKVKSKFSYTSISAYAFKSCSVTTFFTVSETYFE